MVKWASVKEIFYEKLIIYCCLVLKAKGNKNEENDIFIDCREIGKKIKKLKLTKEKKRN